MIGNARRNVHSRPRRSASQRSRGWKDGESESRRPGKHTSPSAFLALTWAPAACCYGCGFLQLALIRLLDLAVPAPPTPPPSILLQEPEPDSSSSFLPFPCPSQPLPSSVARLQPETSLSKTPFIRLCASRLLWIRSKLLASDSLFTLHCFFDRRLKQEGKQSRSFVYFCY